MSAARAVGLLLGVVADSVVGDPAGRRAFRLRTRSTDRAPGRSHAGAAHRPVWDRVPAGGLTSAAVLAGVAFERASRRRPPLRVLGTASATWAALGAARLVAEGTALARLLETGDRDGARTILSGAGSRRVGDLTGQDLARVTVETVAADTADSVVTPLLWGAVAGVPGLLAARTLNLERARGLFETASSGGTGPPRPVGPTGREVAAPARCGWLLVRIDEAAELLPTRMAAALTVTAAPVVGGSAGAAWRVWRRDTVPHTGPNTGRVEAAFAGALGVRLGGRTVHPHGPRELPVLGEGRTPDAGHVTRAVELSRVVGWLAAALSATLALRPRMRPRRAQRVLP